MLKIEDILVATCNKTRTTFTKLTNIIELIFRFKCNCSKLQEILLATANLSVQFLTVCVRCLIYRCLGSSFQLLMDTQHVNIN